MKAVVLVGGEGKRLRPFTSVLPKPLIPIDGKPILQRIIEDLRDSGINEIILSTNYLEDLIKSYFGDGKRFGVNIIYSSENKPLGTAGPIKLVSKRLDGDFLVMNGDLLTDVSFKELYEFHKKNNSDITVVSKNIEIPIRYGLVESDDEDNVVEWKEKPSFNREIGLGIYFLSPRALEKIPDDEFFDMPDLIKSVLGKLVVKKFSFSGKWHDIGQIDDLLDLNGKN